MSTTPPIPSIVARLWGRQHPPRRGPRPSLNFDEIIDSAIDLADTDGLDAVSMNRVAAHLGVTAMALYRYIDSKHDLIVAMVDRATGQPPPLTGDDWRTDLTTWTRANRDLYVAHPWMLIVPRTTPPLGPNGLLWLERVLEALHDTPLDTAEGIGIATTLTGYAHNLASLTTTLGTDPHHPIDSADNYGALVAHLADTEHYPNLSHAATTGAFGDTPTPGAEWINDADLQLGLNLILDGIGALIAHRNPM